MVSVLVTSLVYVSHHSESETFFHSPKIRLLLDVLILKGGIHLVNGGNCRKVLTCNTVFDSTSN